MHNEVCLNETVVDVRDKAKIKIISDPKTAKISEKESNEISEMAQRSREEIKKKYYSSNTPITNAMNRSFWDLFKQFLKMKFGKRLV